ncbi:isoprenylcysteine carboxylmethyltransferase family protein [Rhizobium sp. 2MFCol3.1]|uniref:isoprenylcysteine carboxyl methyltransferase family protein n=1 Tax=Rhizobium sp. 2MFCol3.1 TaxID=1246459 RepID=UPI0003778FB2|nr:isoprenylcysteine carboxylmethyltransferase family protein [Rhizobium sp. 2MFCol3.1]
MWPSILILGFVTVQRLAELIIARRNTRTLIARGAREIGADHYPVMVALHASWLAGLWLLAPGHPVRPVWLVLFVVLQLGRLWVLATLKGRWTTRIIVLPGAPLVREGPYRLFSHPNYAVVIGEIAVLPLVFGMPLYAAIFSVLNGLMLWLRIRVENRALKAAMFLK